MRFEKDNSYGKGRPKGSVNKVALDIKEAFKTLVENNLDKLQEDLNSLESKDRLRFILDLSSFVVPKLKASEIKAELSNDFTPVVSLYFF